MKENLNNKEGSGHNISASPQVYYYNTVITGLALHVADLAESPASHIPYVLLSLSGMIPEWKTRINPWVLQRYDSQTR